MTLEMNEKDFETYKTFTALKNHFSLTSYDYHKYNGKVNVTPESFKRRHDWYQFRKLSKKPDLVGYIIANLLDNPSRWVGDIVADPNSDQRYMRWKKTQQSPMYTFEQDLNKVKGKIEAALVVPKDDDYPQVIKMYRRGEIKLETLVILGDLTGCFSHWTQKISEDIIFPTINRTYEKYRSFLKYDKEKATKIVLKRFGQ